MTPRLLPLFSLSIVLLLLLPACEMSPQAIEFFNKHIGPVFSVKLDSLISKPEAPSSPTDSKDQARRINAEFIREVYQVTLEREPTREEFGRWLNILDQGGSYEGIYNGIVNGVEYLEKEKEKNTASVGALKLYAELMTRFAVDVKYDPLTLKKNSPQPEPGQLPQDMPPPKPTEEERLALINEYTQKGLGKHFNTLKREVALEALKLMDVKKEYREKFATWLGRFVIYSNEKKVDFGLSARNRGDELYHYRWVLQNTDDRCKWEVLNRIHRLFNATKKN